MTVYVRVETAGQTTVIAFDDEKCDHGWEVLRWLEEKHPGERDPERDARWVAMRAAGRGGRKR